MPMHLVRAGKAAHLPPVCRGCAGCTLVLNCGSSLIGRIVWNAQQALEMGFDETDYLHLKTPPMHPIDTVLQELQHRDRQRSRLLRAMESKAATASPAMLSVSNYFQMQIEQAQRAHKFRNHCPNKSPQGSRLRGHF